MILLSVGTTGALYVSPALAAEVNPACPNLFSSQPRYSALLRVAAEKKYLTPEILDFTIRQLQTGRPGNPFENKTLETAQLGLKSAFAKLLLRPEEIDVAEALATAQALKAQNQHIEAEKKVVAIENRKIFVPHVVAEIPVTSAVGTPPIVLKDATGRQWIGQALSSSETDGEGRNPQTLKLYRLTNPNETRTLELPTGVLKFFSTASGREIYSRRTHWSSSTDDVPDPDFDRYKIELRDLASNRVIYKKTVWNIRPFSVRNDAEVLHKESFITNPSGDEAFIFLKEPKTKTAHSTSILYIVNPSKPSERYSFHLNEKVTIGDNVPRLHRDQDGRRYLTYELPEVQIVIELKKKASPVYVSKSDPIRPLLFVIRPLLFVSKKWGLVLGDFVADHFVVHDLSTQTELARWPLPGGANPNGPVFYSASGKKYVVYQTFVEKSTPATQVRILDLDDPAHPIEISMAGNIDRFLIFETQKKEALFFGATSEHIHVCALASKNCHSLKNPNPFSYFTHFNSHLVQEGEDYIFMPGLSILGDTPGAAIKIHASPNTAGL